jgi:hypothetical protein
MAGPVGCCLQRHAERLERLLHLSPTFDYLGWHDTRWLDGPDTGSASSLEKDSAIIHRDYQVALVQKVISKADGVFLWVHLVTTSLCDGLEAGQSPERLHAEVDKYPAELDDYFYDLILERTAGHWLSDTAMTLKLFCVLQTTPWLDTELHYFWLLSRLVQEDTADLTIPLYKRRFGPCPTELSARGALASQTHQFLQGCCRDLFYVREVAQKDNPSDSRAMGEKMQSLLVQPIHRTIFDFAQTRRVQKLLNQHSPSSCCEEDFPSHLLLCRETNFLGAEDVVALSTVQETHAQRRLSALQSSMLHTMRLTRAYERAQGTQSTHLYDMAAAHDEHSVHYALSIQGSLRWIPNRYDFNQRGLGASRDWSKNPQGLCFMLPMFGAYNFSRLLLQLNPAWTNITEELRDAKKGPYLLYDLGGCEFFGVKRTMIDFTLSRLLLQHGAEPNEVDDYRTHPSPWSFLINRIECSERLRDWKRSTGKSSPSVQTRRSLWKYGYWNAFADESLDEDFSSQDVVDFVRALFQNGADMEALFTPKTDELTEPVWVFEDNEWLIRSRLELETAENIDGGPDGSNCSKNGKGASKRDGKKPNSSSAGILRLVLDNTALSLGQRAQFFHMASIDRYVSAAGLR